MVFSAHRKKNTYLLLKLNANKKQAKNWRKKDATLRATP